MISVSNAAVPGVFLAVKSSPCEEIYESISENIPFLSVLIFL